MERGGVPAARRRRKVLGRPAPPAALVGPDDVSRQPRGTPPGRARGGPVRQAPDPGGRSRTRPGRPGDRAAVTAGGWSCPHGIVVDPRQPGAAESHAVLRLLGRRPAPGSSPHRQAGVPETRRGGGSGAPGIPPPSRGDRAPRKASCLFAGGGVAGGGAPSRRGLQVARDRPEFRGGPGAVVRDHLRGFPRPGEHHGGGGRAAPGSGRHRGPV